MYAFGKEDDTGDGGIMFHGPVNVGVFTFPF